MAAPPGDLAAAEKVRETDALLAAWPLRRRRVPPLNAPPLPAWGCRDGRLRTRLQQRLRALAVQALTDAGLRRAAVALAVVDAGHGADLPSMPHHSAWSRRPALLLTRRAATLRHHAGQWALPGGRIDAGETPEQAALRELGEETGVVVAAARVLGRLDDFATRSGFVITPVVLWAGPARRLRADRAEVESIHRLPVSELLRPDAPLLEASRHGEHPVLRMPVGDSWIAAPTAAVLYQFREVCMFGRPTRVAHYDQPEFAWR